MLVILMLALVSCAGIARADIFGFIDISNPSSVNAAIGSAQLSVDVTGGSNFAYFKFMNSGPKACSICDIYFDDRGKLLVAPLQLQDKDNAIGGVYGNSGVDFSLGASPSNLPDRNNITPSFKTTKNLLADSDCPVEHNGVNPGEWLGIRVTLACGKNIADVINGMNTGDLRIGLHVQGFDACPDSQSFVSYKPVPPHPVPLPASAIMGGLGLGSAGVLTWLRRRFRKA
jgi:hypothetical protein